VGTFISVGIAADAIGVPQLMQNFAPSLIVAPQLEQNIVGHLCISFSSQHHFNKMFLLRLTRSG